MEQEKFAEFKLKVIKYVTDKWLEFNQEFPPHLFFTNENGGRKMLPLPMEGFHCADSKEALVMMIIEMLDIVKAKMYCITTEGWMVAAKEGEDLRDKNGDILRPSEHPDKQEVLTFMFEDINGVSDLMTLLNTNGKLTPHNPGSMIGGEGGQLEGIFTGLLKKSKEND